MNKSIVEIFNRRQALEAIEQYSIVMPVYNEIECLPAVVDDLYEYLAKVQARHKWQLIFVDDCSTDGSFDYLSARATDLPGNVNLAVVRLAKNSGSHVAITAGLNLSVGRFTIVMASDGQDPVEVIGSLIEKKDQGYQLILASRSDNMDHGIIGKLFSSIAWKIMNWATDVKMPTGGCDMLGLDALVVSAFNRLDERNTTFIYRLLSLGFKQTTVSYTKRARYAGKSKWSIKKKIGIMLDAIAGYSSKPLKLITRLGLFLCLILLIRWGLVFYKVYILHNEPSSIEVLLNTFFSTLAVQLLILGAIGSYIWRILDETRKRPVYEISHVAGEIFTEIDQSE